LVVSHFIYNIIISITKWLHSVQLGGLSEYDWHRDLYRRKVTEYIAGTEAATT